MLYTIDIWTAVCVFECWELIVRCMRLKKWSMREREHFYQRDSAYPSFTNFKLIDNELWLPGKTGRLVTQSLTLQMLKPLFQIVSSRFGSLSVRCGYHTETRYSNAPYPMTETHIFKDKTVNLAYRMYFECPVVLK